jgi:hypothetical protein
MKIAIIILLALFASQSFAYNMYRVQCESLQGSGYVMVWVGDLEFKIPVECR